MSALYILDNFYPFLLKITVLPEIFHISCQRRGITAHINDLLRCHLYDRLKAELITSLSWRIDNNHIGFDVVLFVLFREDFFGFADVELYVGEAVALCVFSRVLNGCRNDLDTADFSGFPGVEGGDRSNSALESPYGLAAV